MGGPAALLRATRYALPAAVSAIIAGVLIAFAADDRGYGLYRPWISEKLAVLGSRPPVPDVFFIGPSVALRSIDPGVVDAEAVAAGCGPIRSVNLAMPGAMLFEDAFMLDRVLETPGLKPGSLVVYHVASKRDFTFEQIAKSDRSPVAARLRYVPDLYAVSQASLDDGIQLAAYLRAAVGEALGFHALSDLAMRRWRQDSPFEDARVRWSGYVPLEMEVSRRRGRKRFLDDTSILQRNLDTWSVERFKDDSIVSNPFAERIRRAGLIPVIFAAPWKTGAMVAAVQRAQAADRELRAVTISKDNAPDLFAGTDLWFDQGHVSSEGARLVSSIVGRQLCAIVKTL